MPPRRCRAAVRWRCWCGRAQSRPACGKAADEATGGAVGRAFAAAEFAGKEGQSCTILAPGAGLSRIVAIGLGKDDALTERRLEDAGGALAAALSREPSAAVAADGLTGAQAVQVALGAALRTYRFDIYRTQVKAGRTSRNSPP